MGSVGDRPAALPIGHAKPRQRVAVSYDALIEPSNHANEQSHPASLRNRLVQSETGFDGMPIRSTNQPRVLSVGVVVRQFVLLLSLSVVTTLIYSGTTRAQAPAPAVPESATSGWQTVPTQPKPALPRPSPGTPANTTVVPRQVAPAKIDPQTGVLELSAFLTEDGEAIEQGLVWRVFAEPASGAAAKGDGRPRLVGIWRDAAPKPRLAAGNYIVNVAFGRAHLTRRVTLDAGGSSRTRMVLNAGGLRVTANLAGAKPGADAAITYDIYQGELDRTGVRTKVMTGTKPGLIVRLNAGIYHIVSTFGDANAVVRAEVAVEAGKLTEAAVNHHGAKVTFKLVTRAGGEALSDAQWIVQSAQGDLVRESMGALPTHILAAGDYVVSAHHGGRIFKREFTVVSGEAAEVEVIIQ